MPQCTFIPGALPMMALQAREVSAQKGVEPTKRQLKPCNLKQGLGDVWPAQRPTTCCILSDNLPVVVLIMSSNFLHFLVMYNSFWSVIKWCWWEWITRQDTFPKLRWKWRIYTDEWILLSLGENHWRLDCFICFNIIFVQGHLHELGITCLGDRIYLTELIGLLKKKKREAELSAAKWSGVTPAPGIAYKEDCGECCVAYFCPCCLAKTYWRVTGQGVFYKREPPCGLWTEGEKIVIMSLKQTSCPFLRSDLFPRSKGSRHSCPVLLWTMELAVQNFLSNWTKWIDHQFSIV